MNALKKYFESIRPQFEKGGRLHALWSIYDGFSSFLFVPNTTSKSGVSIHDAIDSKRIMTLVVLAVIPAMLFGMYNVGYQNALAAGKLAETGFWAMFFFGFLAVLPKILVSYIVGLGIEFAWAQWKHEEIQEGFLVSGILIPLIIPVNTPLWMLVIAVAFAVIFAKEIFGGTGMNIFNVAIAVRMFLFFSYPGSMTGDKCWIYQSNIFGLGYDLPDTFTQATPLGAIAQFAAQGKRIRKKDLGLMASTYGYVYVAQVAMGADQAQTLKAFREAEAYDGPSVVIAYSPCINHGLKAGMGKSQAEEAKAVACGYWHLWRYNPTLENEGKNPFILDSKEPNWDDFKDFLAGEVRYLSVKKMFPQEADELFEAAKDNAQWRYNNYKRLANMEY